MISARKAAPRLMSSYMLHSIDSSHLANFPLIAVPAKWSREEEEGEACDGGGCEEVKGMVGVKEGTYFS